MSGILLQQCCEACNIVVARQYIMQIVVYFVQEKKHLHSFFCRYVFPNKLISRSEKVSKLIIGPN